jgi:hypothetical protein
VLDTKRLQHVLDQETEIEAEDPELLLDQKQTTMDLNAPPRVPTGG